MTLKATLEISSTTYAKKRGLEFSNFQLFVVSSLIVISLVTIAGLWHIRQKLEVESLTRKYTRELENAFTAGNPSKNEYIDAIRKSHGKIQDSHAAYITSLISRNNQDRSVFARELAKTIVKVSRTHNLDPLLVTAIIKAESTFNHTSVSNKGALGLMQVKPETGAYISAQLDSLEWRGANQLQNPSYNVEVGVAYLRYLMKKFDNNIEKALIAYNWGPGNLIKALKGEMSVPESTRTYAKKILGNQQRWKGELKQAQLVLTAKQLA